MTSLRVGSDVAPAPRVTVVVPAFKVAEFIAEAISSVVRQTCTDHEIVVVNDGSPDSDDLEAALDPFLERINYVRQENGGAAAARNAGIRIARGEVIAFLDGDDVWLPEYLASQLLFLDERELDMAYCDALLFGDSSYEGIRFMRSSPSSGAVTTESLIAGRCNVITSGTVVRKSVLLDAGLFDTTLRAIEAEDFDLWYRIAKAGARIGYQRRVLAKYRVRADSLSGSNVARAERSIRALESIRSKYGLSSGERAAWEERMRLYQAALSLEMGKLHLVNGAHAAAQADLARANAYFRKPKLFIVGVMLRLSPALTMRIFRRVRRSELH